MPYLVCMCKTSLLSAVQSNKTVNIIRDFDIINSIFFCKKNVNIIFETGF